MTTFNFGIQSWCFRNFKTIPELASQLKALGITHTELCGVHADFSSPETFDACVEELKSHEITPISMGVQTLFGTPADRNNFEFCRKSGCKYMSVSFLPDGLWEAFKSAERLAEEYDVKLGIHNHGGHDWLGTDTMLDYVFRHTGPRIGLTLDAAWALDAWQNPVAWVEKFGSRLHGVHMKDFAFNRNRSPQDTIIGEGNLDLPAFTNALKKVGFSGFTVIEYEGDIENPGPALSKCVEKLASLDR